MKLCHCLGWRLGCKADLGALSCGLAGIRFSWLSSPLGLVAGVVPALPLPLSQFRRCGAPVTAVRSSLSLPLFHGSVLFSDLFWSKSVPLLLLAICHKCISSVFIWPAPALSLCQAQLTPSPKLRNYGSVYHSVYHAVFMVNFWNHEVYHWNFFKYYENVKEVLPDFPQPHCCPLR